MPPGSAGPSRAPSSSSGIRARSHVLPPCSWSAPREERSQRPRLAQANGGTLLLCSAGNLTLCSAPRWQGWRCREALPSSPCLGTEPGKGIPAAPALPLSDGGVDPVSELAYAGVDGRRVDVAVAVSPGDDADQGPDVPVLVYKWAPGVTLRRGEPRLRCASILLVPRSRDLAPNPSLPPQTPAPLGARSQAPQVQRPPYPQRPRGAGGIQLLTWQEEAPTPPAHSMELVILLPQYCMHWLWETRGRVTCCRRTAKALAGERKRC